MIEASRKMGLIFFPAFDWAISPTHPEREERLLYTQDQILEEGILDVPGILQFRPDVAGEADIQRVHFCVPDLQGQATESHLISAGGAMKAAHVVCGKEVDCAFALVRPPGHHSMRIVHGNRGFCTINIEAVMIEYMRDLFGVNRVAIVDTDCHHGDGTQDIYWHDPDTLFISIHQDGRTLYPGSGFADEFGGPWAAGYTLNVPLPPQTSDEGYLHVIDNLVVPVLEEFQPEIVINSAGQDNHYSDPITSMRLSAQGYAALNSRIKPDIAVLEGGYSIEGALPYVNMAIILAMAGMDYSHVEEPDFHQHSMKMERGAMAHIADLVEEIKGIWKSRAALRSRLCAGKSQASRQRTIFYDTDGIIEHQDETIKICGECSGLLTIDSTSDRGNRILALHIPRKACDDCRKEGRERFERASEKDYTWIYFQDRVNNLFERR
jgi:acetoin utilization deacetylase AcuC-like enzyme